MKKNIKIIFVCLFIIIIIYLIYFKINNKFNLEDFKDDKELKQFDNSYIKEEKLCLEFTINELSSNSGGIYTNYLDTNEVVKNATGHEILSESIGLAMLYFIEKDNKQQFDIQYKYMINNMFNKVGLLKWRIRENNHNIGQTSASIDDLRVIRALALAYNKWKDENYIKDAFLISENMLKYNITDNNLNNYYDVDMKAKSNEIDLAYVDLYTINNLSKNKNEWKIILNNSVNIINKGFISEELPLYYKTYNIGNEKFNNQSKLNMIDSLLVILHLSEVDMVKKSSVDWIKRQFEQYGVVYSEYNIKTGKPSSKEESTAVYAIIARIAKEINDEELYKKAIERMILFQVKDKDNEIFGSFGDENTLKVYSFDNLQALLGF